MQSYYDLDRDDLEGYEEHFIFTNYYFDLEVAIENNQKIKDCLHAVEFFQKEFPDLQFVVKTVIPDHELHESEMIIYSEWAFTERFKK